MKGLKFNPAAAAGFVLAFIATGVVVRQIDRRLLGGKLAAWGAV